GGNLMLHGSRGLLWAAAAASVFAPSAYAKKPAELNARLVEPSVILQGQGIRISTPFASPRLFTRPDFVVTPGTPVQMAREYLSKNADLLKMKASLDDLVFDSVVETPGGYHVHFHQRFGKLVVEHSDINVTIDRDEPKVTFVMSSYHPILLLVEPHAIIPSR